MEDEISEDAVKAFLTNRPAGKFVSLNFKVPLHVRLQFKISAAQQNLTMTELLLKLLAEHFATQKVLPTQLQSQNDEIKK